MTTNLEILVQQLNTNEEKQGFLDGFNVDSDPSVNKISLNITSEEEAILDAIGSLPNNLAGSNRSEIIRTLIRIGFEHIQHQTTGVMVDTGIKYSGYGINPRNMSNFDGKEHSVIIPMALYLHHCKISYLRAHHHADSLADSPDAYKALFSDEYTNILAEACIESYENLNKVKGK